MMNEREAKICLHKVFSLPARRCAYCVVLAAENVQDVWTEYCTSTNVTNYSSALITIFKEWYSQPARTDELKSVSNVFYRTLPQNLAEEDDPAGGYAGWSLFDAVLIGLEQCEDVEWDVFVTAISYSYTAAERIKLHPESWNGSGFSEKELIFIEEWYSRCEAEYPELEPAGCGDETFDG